MTKPKFIKPLKNPAFYKSLWELSRKYWNSIIWLILAISLVIFLILFWQQLPTLLDLDAIIFWGKSAWEWTELLIVPILLAIGGFGIQEVLKQQEELREEKEKAIADDKFLEEAWRDYQARITLVLNDNYSKSSIAVENANTLTVLRRLDFARKGFLIKFLVESEALRLIALSTADLSYINVIGTDLSYASLSKATLSFADLSFVNFSHANLSDADLRFVNLRFANLYNTDLRYSNFKSACLKSANLKEADLSGANLEEVDLSRADLTRANLTGANLRNANLSGAMLKRANLIEADLTGANLVGANLHKADMSKAKLKNTKLKGANLKKTILYEVTDLALTSIRKARDWSFAVYDEPIQKRLHLRYKRRIRSANSRTNVVSEKSNLTPEQLVSITQWEITKWENLVSKKVSPVVGKTGSTEAENQASK